MTNNIRTIPVLCNVCGSDKADTLWFATDRLHGFGGSFQYVRCKNCGLVYMNPRLSADSIGQFYPDDYAPHQVVSSPADVKTPPAGLPRVILDSLNARSRVLDIGCGTGDFLNHLRKFCGCRVDGVDISEKAVLIAKQQYGIDVFRGDIQSALFEHNWFDLITAWSCIEHTHDPAQVLHKAFTLCRQSGWLFIKTPNFESLSAKLFKDRWYHLDCPRHLYIFSPSNLTMLLEKSGFEVVKIGFETSSKGWLGSLQYVFYGDNVNPRTKNKLKRSSLARLFISPVSHLAALLKRGDVITIAARRKI